VRKEEVHTAKRMDPQKEVKENEKEETYSARAQRPWKPTKGRVGKSDLDSSRRRCRESQRKGQRDEKTKMLTVVVDTSLQQEVRYLQNGKV